MAGTGPPPSATPNPNRRRRNAPTQFTKLPAEGRQGEPPPWPLPPDLKSQAKLERLNGQIDEAELAANTDDDKERRAAERRLLSLREQADVLTRTIAMAAGQEETLWRELWATPQAVAWERLRWTREVGQYVRWKIAAELGDLDASKEARLLSDRLGLNPVAMLRLRWEVVADEVSEQRSGRATRASSAKPRTRSRGGLKAVD